MLVTLTHPISNFSGTVTVLETVQLPFTNGTSNVDIPSSAFGAINNLRILITVGGQAPAPPYDSNLDGTVAPLVTNVGSQTAVALKAASVLPMVGGYTYNADGTVASGPAGETYAYNTDGTVHSVTLNGTTRVYTYNTDGSVASAA